MDQTVTTSESLAAPDHLRRDLFRLALPVLAEQLLVFCVGFYDVYLAGLLGKEETSAIGLSAYVSWLAYLIFSLVGAGTVAIVARTWGAGQFEDARRIAARSLTITVVFAAGIFLLLQVVASVFPFLLNMQGVQRRIAVEYLRMDACGQFFSGWTLIGAAALRGSGDMRSPLLVLTVTNIVNVIVSTACVWGWGPLPEMGVTGIVTGTVTAQFCGAMVMSALLFSGVSRIQVRWSEFEFHRETIQRILRIGGPAALGGIATFAGHFLFLMVISRLSPLGFDGATFAAHIVGIRIESLSYLPVEAFGIAAATLVGQSLGAGHVERARRAAHEAIRQCLGYAGLMTILFFGFAPAIYAGMQSNADVALVGVPAFRLMALYQIPNAILIVYINALRGAGDTRFPLLCSLIGNLLVRVSVGYVCGVVLNGGLFGAWIGMGADNILRAIMVSWRYQAGRWIKIKV
ncbi:MAG: MATE family efflux transporter [Planctomycetes bacterium]|nr:MATE family efflux transporter [Planctomycetota bacterium]